MHWCTPSINFFLISFFLLGLFYIFIYSFFLLLNIHAHTFGHILALLSLLFAFFFPFRKGFFVEQHNLFDALHQRIIMTTEASSDTHSTETEPPVGPSTVNTLLEAVVLDNLAGASHAPKLPPSQGPQLLVINRSIDRASHPKNQFSWRRPWSWFWSGERVSPLQWSSEDGSHTTPGTLKSLPPQTEAPAELLSLSPRRRAGLPPLNTTTPLTEEIVVTLHEDVQAKRQQVLASEAKIHEKLQAIEDTRERYLSVKGDVSAALSCRKEVSEVSRCYLKANELSDEKRRAFKARQAAWSAEAAGSPASQVVFARSKHEVAAVGVAEEAKGSTPLMDQPYPLWMQIPVVAFDAFQCRNAVEALQKCTEERLIHFSETDPL